MSLREIVFFIGLVIMICHIVKAYILKIRLTPKEKILLKYAPKKIFLLVNIGFVFSLKQFSIFFYSCLNERKYITT